VPLCTTAVALFLAALPGGTVTAGGPGSAFGEGLRLTNTAWAIGLSEAMVASGEGVSAVALNPAGVVDAGVTTVHVTHIFYVEGMQEDYLAYTMRLPFGSAIGVSVHGLYDSGTGRTLEDANGVYAGESGRYPLGFAVGGLAYAMDLSGLTRWFDALRPTGGVGLRAVWQQIDQQSYAGVTFDVGFKLRPFTGITIAGVLQNAGTVTGPAGLPLQWVTGIAWQNERVGTRNDRLLLEIDSPVAVDRDISLRAGLEYRVQFSRVGVAIRGGWKQENEVPGAPGVSAGIGFRWLIGRLPWGMDYAYVPWGVFGGEHAVSMTVGIIPKPKTIESDLGPADDGREAPEVFYPLKGERARYALKIEERSELSAILLDAGGAPLATLFEKQIVEPGEYEIIWNGYLPNGELAPLEMIYRILIQYGLHTWYRDVIPKRE